MFRKVFLSNLVVVSVKTLISMLRKCCNNNQNSSSVFGPPCSAFSASEGGVKSSNVAMTGRWSLMINALCSSVTSSG